MLPTVPGRMGSNQNVPPVNLNEDRNSILIKKGLAGMLRPWAPVAGFEPATRSSAKLRCLNILVSLKKGQQATGERI
jgi:hypothetical protein